MSTNRGIDEKDVVYIYISDQISRSVMCDSLRLKWLSSSSSIRKKNLKKSVYLAESLCYISETNTTLWIKYAKSLQSCPTLCDPIDGSPPGSAIPGILQARTLEWVAISFSNAWMWKVKVKSLSRVWVFTTPWTEAYQAPPSTGFSRQEYWSGVPLPNKSYPKLELSVSSFIPKENQKGYGPKQ